MNNRGMTLIELLIVLVIVVLVLAAAFWSFSRLFQGFKSQTKVSEAHISSLIGFELLRKDIEMAGFGLPYNCSGISFDEAASSSPPPPDPSSYNAAPSNVKPFELGNNANSNGNSDYLVIRSVFNPQDDETTKWAYFLANSTGGGGGTGCSAFVLQEGAGGSFNTGTHVIVEDGEADLRDIKRNGTDWAFTITSSGLLDKCPDVSSGGDFFLVYAVRDNSGPIAMPFNRVDYYLKKPSSLPQKCAKEFDVYELYRSHVKHGSSAGSGKGDLDEQPLIDCVRDFQVAFLVGNNSSASWQDTPPSTAYDQKHKIREVRVFILYQEGQKEREAVSTTTINLGDNETGTLSTFDPSSYTDADHYHWKVKEISIKPMNLGR